MKTFKIFFLLIFISNLFLSCETEKPEFPKFLFVLSNSIDNLKEGDNLPNSIKTLIGYYEIEDEDSECYQNVYAPEVEYYRVDLDKSEKAGTPLSSSAKLQKSFGTLSSVNLKEMYNIDLFKVTNIFVKSGKGKDVKNKSYKNPIKVNLFSNKTELQKVRDEVKKQLCEGSSQIIFILENTPNLDEEITISTDVEKKDENVTTNAPQNPCNSKSISEASDLVFEAMQILDTSLDYDVRRENAKNIFKKYFDEQAYVAVYSDHKSKNPKIWDTGEGVYYFVDRLAALESVNSISVFRAEFSKETGKISGIHIVECHNASELIQ